MVVGFVWPITCRRGTKKVAETQQSETSGAAAALGNIINCQNKVTSSYGVRDPQQHYVRETSSPHFAIAKTRY